MTDDVGSHGVKVCAGGIVCVCVCVCARARARVCVQAALEHGVLAPLRAYRGHQGSGAPDV